MAIPVISKIVQKNNGIFKLMDGKNVAYKGQESVSIDDKIDTVSKKYICFVMSDINQGAQQFECLVPFNGIVTSISAICATNTSENVQIDIEKANLADRVNWTTILGEKLVINIIDGTQTYTVSDSTVNKDDIFRINILNNVNIPSLTVNIEISI